MGSVRRRPNFRKECFLSLKNWLLRSCYSTAARSPGIEKSAASVRGPIQKILIANRGEIACRIIKTARELGLRTVAVYSDVDKSSLHVRRADEAVHIGPASAQLSYLSTSAILDAAQRTGADAIHPGYGFLSENAKFAQSCIDSGITFIGPSAKAISLMGDKSASKKLMSAADVPVVPGYHGDEQSYEVLKSEADTIGYPVLIKPVLGGGGKGMRIVYSQDEFMDNLTSALRESRAAFGDTRVLIEKYIARPRHIEVQIFGDKSGNVVHLFERDCSVQRRHQKIIEEAPAPVISDGFRKSIGQAAVDAAKAVNYENAGTVEFIVDTTTGKFFFMEMNTRLQVEHPVTEMVTRQDLVEWQIRVANGERLPLEQHQIPLTGHAFEARVYAENVPRGFLPAAGFLHHYHPPARSSTVRVETGVEESDSVSVHYDPMIAKLVVWGNNRDMALSKLHNCLCNFQVAGVPTNISFLKKLAMHPAFGKGEVETHFIEHFKEDLLQFSEGSLTNVRQFAALAAVGICLKDKHYVSQQSTDRRAGGIQRLWHTPSGFRLNQVCTRKISLNWEPEADGSSSESITLSVSHSGSDDFLVKLPGEQLIVIKLAAKGVGTSGHDFLVEIDGVSSTVSYGYYTEKSSFHIHVWRGDQHYHFSMPLRETSDFEVSEGHTGAQRTENTGKTPGAVVAPMAGLVVKVLAEQGASVETGDALLVLEAMKMEHTVKAHVAGTITAVNAAVGQQVGDGALLFRIQKKEDK